MDFAESPTVVQLGIIHTVANDDGCVHKLLRSDKVTIDRRTPLVELTVDERVPWEAVVPFPVLKTVEKQVLREKWSNLMKACWTIFAAS